MPHSHCFGCGPDNPNGLRIKSYWSGDELSVAKFTPEPYHCAGPKHFVNGGIIATVIDCHCVCTAGAWAYRDRGRPLGGKPDLHYATAKLELAYLRPTPVAAELELAAQIAARRDSTYVVSCELSARGKTCVRGTVEAVLVPASWIEADRAAS